MEESELHRFWGSQSHLLSGVAEGVAKLLDSSKVSEGAAAVVVDGDVVEASIRYARNREARRLQLEREADRELQAKASKKPSASKPWGGEAVRLVSEDDGRGAPPPHLFPSITAFAQQSEGATGGPISLRGSVVQKHTLAEHVLQPFDLHGNGGLGASDAERGLGEAVPVGD